MKSKRRPVARLAFDLKSSTKVLDARLHVGDAVHILVWMVARKAAAVVCDPEVQLSILNLGIEPHLGSSGMVNHIS